MGPYEILAPLGAGGMGEVYKARDTRLDRTVAVKVLPESLFKDGERVARFEREAKTLAALNHPNVAAIYAFEEISSRHLLAMELVEGDDLAARLKRGAIPVDEALSIAKQIAEGLEAAHEKGIVHRDLKPANIKISPEGKVKILDFGIAKIFAGDGGSDSSPAVTQSPTLTARATAAGVILGTAAYMSPEQARGKPVDKRADIWAFGAVLYEMLTGRRAFEGETVSDTLAAVLRAEADFSLLPADTPPSVRSLLRRTLQKDPRLRLRDIADARLEIGEPLGFAGEAPASPPARASRGGTFRLLGGISAAAFVLSVVLGALLIGAVRRENASAERVQRFQFVPSAGERLVTAIPNGNPYRAFAVSPDGATLAYVVTSSGRTSLRVRSFDSAESREVPGTQLAQHPFFSPDGKWIAFVAGPKLRKVALSGGTPVTLCDAPQFRGGAWGDDGGIYFVPNVYVPVFRIPADGGTPRAVTKIRTEEKELLHRWPEILPGGKTLLYAVGFGGEWDDAWIVAERLDTGERKVVVKGGTFPRYLPTGHLVYGRAGALYAVAFDARTLTVGGAPVLVARSVLNDSLGIAHMDFSRSGLLVTEPAESTLGSLMLSWVDRAGRSEAIAVPRQEYNGLSISPDGGRVVLTIGNSIGILDLSRLTIRKLTLPARAENAVWLPDGRRLFFALEKGRSYQVHGKAADDSGEAQVVFSSEASEDPLSLSADGSRLLTCRTPPDGQNELLARGIGPGAASREPTRLVKSLFFDLIASLSPDGRWAAYESEESGRPEIYVRPVSDEDRKWQVSTDGGAAPVWSRDGREVFFLSGMRLLAAPVEVKGGELQVGAPKVLFENHEIFYFDVTPDGRRFLVAENPDPNASPHLDVIVNWFAEVGRKVREARVP